MKKALVLSLWLLISAARADIASSLEFLEAFAWGDRQDAIAMLAPNIEDYYYYQALHLQLSNQSVALEEHMRQWRAFLGNRGASPRYRELGSRRHFLEFDRHPEDTWKMIRDELNLLFNHSRRGETRESTAPSTVNPSVYSLESFLAAAHRHSGFPRYTDRGLELLDDRDFTGELRRVLLSRIRRPDYPGLVNLILADLDFENSRGFGSIPIHHQLTRVQVEALGRRRPELLREAAYVHARLARMPAPDIDLEHDHAAAIEYYRQVWDFVRTLEPMHNSLKAGVLFNLLDHQRRLGIYDEAIFREYLELPRRTGYLPGERLQQLRAQPAIEVVNFNYRPGGSIVLPPIGDEEPLVREFLLHFFRDAPSPDAFERWFESRWLNAVFAESKILHGIGRPEDQAGRLTPAQYREILDRVELNFTEQNPSYLRPGERVELQIDVKRVDSILVKIYELHTFNYYTSHRAPVDQAVDLDGLVATFERTLDTSALPGRRIRHTITVPEIKRRGVYVVELIGGGISSRALLHVGRLESVSQATASGQAVMVFNDAGDHVINASVWIDGREFDAGEHGLVLLPYSENPGLRFAVLRDGDFSSPEQVFHQGESYEFTAGIHLDPQNLPRRRAARLILRPDLRINGLPLDPARLGEVAIMLASVDARGTRTERSYTTGFERNREWVREFHVPDDVRQFQVEVSAKIRRRIDNQEIDLQDRFSLNINPARAGDTMQQVFLLPGADGWRLELLGLDGEPIARQRLTLTFQHPAVSSTINAYPATDAEGRIDLGPLTDIERLQVSGPDNLRLNLPLRTAAAVLPERLHVRRGETISLAYPYKNTAGLTPATLLRMERGIVQEEFSARVSIEDGELRIARLAAGEYSLQLHEAGLTIEIIVTDGEARHGFFFEPRRRLQETVAQMPSVRAAAREGNRLRIDLRQHTPSTRVAIRAARYAGAGGELPAGLGYPAAARRRIDYPPLQYVSGRNIGDEYRYVLDRRLQRAFAGSLLARPGLILNPWETRETVAERERLRDGEAYRAHRGRMAAAARDESARRRREEPDGRRVSVPATDIGFDFLPLGSQWWVNLQPDENGRIEVDLSALNEHTWLEINVLDRFGASRSQYLLPDGRFDPRPVRLLSGLDPRRSFSRQKNVRALASGETVVFDDLATTSYQAVRTFGQAFDLLRTLGGNEHMDDFAFLKQWPDLDHDERLAKYGEYASHELHLFIYMRDRAFFDAVIRPYLANKKDKTFIDRWLLDELMPEDSRLDHLLRRNVLELALLARRGGDAAAIQAALREKHELIPDDPDAFARLVRVALQAADLDEEAARRRQEARELAEAASPVIMRSLYASRGADGREAAAGVQRHAASKSRRPADPALEEVAAFSLREEFSADMVTADMEDAGVQIGFDALDMAEMPFGEVAQLYRALPKTKELAEHNYYRLRMRDDTPERIRVNRFWRDVADGRPVSARLLEAHGSLTETLAALTFSGLPWEAPEPEEEQEGAVLRLTAGSPLVMVTEQILPAEDADDDRPLLISQQYFRPDDRYRHEGNEQIEKFVTGEFIRRVVYGGRVIMSNPTSSRRRLNVLMQLPLGAIPLKNGFYTDDRFVRLEAYSTSTIEYFFYFPFSGEFPQFAAHAADDEAIIGRAERRIFRVVDEPTEIDRASWAWIARHGDPADVLDYLATHNLRRTDLAEIAWRLRDRDFFTRVYDLLESRLHFDNTVCSYAIYHQDIARARIWLAQSPLAGMVGPALDSPLLTVDPVTRRTYEHLEYDPLVNPRVHPLGEQRTILNPAVNQQYRAFLANAVYRHELDAHERLALVYYLILQDRIGEAMDQLALLPPADVNRHAGAVTEPVARGLTHERLQTDYLRAWLALRTLEIDRAQTLIAPHIDHPAPRWRARFRAAHDLITAARDGAAAAAAQEDDPSRQQRLDRAAGDSPALEMKQDANRILVYAHNLPRATLNLYPVDIELFFSRRPFTTAAGGGFGIVKPAHSVEIELPADGAELELDMPADFKESNVVVELAGRGLREIVTRYSNRMRVRIMQSFGQIEIRSSETGNPVPRAYVKVYARSANGRESFWKDGYTDMRGRFDYLSLNDREPEEAVRFAILVMHPELGAVIRETTPPTR